MSADVKRGLIRVPLVTNASVVDGFAIRNDTALFSFKPLSNLSAYDHWLKRVKPMEWERLRAEAEGRARA